MRPTLVALAFLTGLAPAVHAQAPDAGPLVLRLPASTRATALGNAWVVGRDDDVVFYNPAMITGRTGFALSLARYKPGSASASVSGSYSAGPRSLSIGWGMQFVSFHTAFDAKNPFAPDILLSEGPADAASALATVGANMTWKGFRIGTGVKYATDRISSAFNAVVTPAGTIMNLPNSGTREVFLLDAGLSRPLFSGTAALSVQNIGHGSSEANGYQPVPFQAALGWSGNKNTDQLDIGLFGQVTAREGWIAPGGGVELGYGWIEGWSATVRAGARRPESISEKPFAVGGTLNADHLSVDYALQFFDGGHYANRMTIRWR